MPAKGRTRRRKAKAARDRAAALLNGGEGGGAVGGAHDEEIPLGVDGVDPAPPFPNEENHGPLGVGGVHPAPPFPTEDNHGPLGVDGNGDLGLPFPNELEDDQGHLVDDFALLGILPLDFSDTESESSEDGQESPLSPTRSPKKTGKKGRKREAKPHLDKEYGPKPAPLFEREISLFEDLHFYDDDLAFHMSRGKLRHQDSIWSIPVIIVDAELLPHQLEDFYVRSEWFFARYFKLYVELVDAAGVTVRVPVTPFKEPSVEERTHHIVALKRPDESRAEILFENYSLYAVAARVVYKGEDRRKVQWALFGEEDLARSRFNFKRTKYTPQYHDVGQVYLGEGSGKRLFKFIESFREGDEQDDSAALGDVEQDAFSGRDAAGLKGTEGEPNAANVGTEVDPIAAFEVTGEPSAASEGNEGKHPASSKGKKGVPSAASKGTAAKPTAAFRGTEGVPSVACKGTEGNRAAASKGKKGKRTVASKEMKGKPNAASKGMKGEPPGASKGTQAEPPKGTEGQPSASKGPRKHKQIKEGEKCLDFIFAVFSEVRRFGRLREWVRLGGGRFPWEYTDVVQDWLALCKCILLLHLHLLELELSNVDDRMSLTAKESKMIALDSWKICQDELSPGLIFYEENFIDADASEKELVTPDLNQLAYSVVTLIKSEEGMWDKISLRCLGYCGDWVQDILT